jgi:hypothetical protein
LFFANVSERAAASADERGSIDHVQSPEHAHRPASKRTSQARDGSSAEGREDYLLDLQRRFGNAAVTTLVQRAPRNRPASTDAPGRRPKPKKRGGSTKAPPKKAAADIRARVIKFETDKGESLITIASGLDQGVKVGMDGSLVKPNGTEVADFVIEKAQAGVSWAHVKATHDQVNENPNVLIKASKFVSESQAGKEF